LLRAVENMGGLGNNQLSYTLFCGDHDGADKYRFINSLAYPEGNGAFPLPVSSQATTRPIYTLSCAQEFDVEVRVCSPETLAARTNLPIDDATEVILSLPFIPSSPPTSATSLRCFRQLKLQDYSQERYEGMGNERIGLLLSSLEKLSDVQLLSIDEVLIKGPYKANFVSTPAYGDCRPDQRQFLEDKYFPNAEVLIASPVEREVLISKIAKPETFLQIQPLDELVANYNSTIEM